MQLKLPKYGQCFVCGDENPAGLGVRFTWDGDRVRTEFAATEARAGYRGIVHGGVLTALVDETMGWAASVMKRRLCVAAELTVRFIKPALVGKRLFISGWLASDRGRLFEAEGEIRDEDGTLLATGKGKFIPFPADSSREIVAYLEEDTECWPVETLFGE